MQHINEWNYAFERKRIQDTKMDLFVYSAFGIPEISSKIIGTHEIKGIGDQLIAEYFGLTEDEKNDKI